MTPERRVRLAVALFAGVMVVGVVGYQLIEGYTLVEALYMTVITVATVGFREVRPMGTGGMLFTIALITAGLAAVTFAVASGIEFVVEGHLTRMIERRRMDRAIESLRDHVII